MKRVELNKSKGDKVPLNTAAVETVLFERIPQVVAHLTHVRYEDGSARQTGTITLRTRGGSWYAEARDYDAGARLIACAQSCDDALALLDLLLGSDDAPWEPDRYIQDAKNGKKK